MAAKVVTSTRNGIRTLLLNRPEKKNALDGEMYPLLTGLLRGAREEEGVKVDTTFLGNLYYLEGCHPHRCWGPFLQWK